MNSSTNFIYSLVKKLKLPLLGYAIIILTSFIGSLISVRFFGSSHPFTSILIFSAGILPYLIITFAVLKLFSFRSHKAYAIFLTTIPITKSRQLKLSVLLLIFLTFLFSIIACISTIFFNSFITFFTFNSFPLNQIINMSIIYFVTLLFFTAYITFIKILLIHDRSFFIALFFSIISFYILLSIPSPILPNSLTLHSLIPIPFNLLHIPQSFPQIGILRLSLLLFGTLCFSTLSFYLYKKESETHQSIKIQKIATVIIYSLILTPTLYTVYQYSSISLIFVFLIVLILLAIIILKLSFNKIPILTLLIPFIISNTLSISFIIATPYIVNLQLMNDWKQTHFKSQNKISLYLSNATVFNQPRNLQINFEHSPFQQDYLEELSKSAELSVTPDILYPDPYTSPKLTKDYLSIGNNNTSFVIHWNSTEAKLNFEKKLEQFIQSLDSKNENNNSNESRVSKTATLLQFTPESCFINSNLDTTCGDKQFREQHFNIPSFEKAATKIDTLQTDPNKKTDSVINLDVSFFDYDSSHVSVFISL